MLNAAYEYLRNSGPVTEIVGLAKPKIRTGRAGKADNDRYIVLSTPTIEAENHLLGFSGILHVDLVVDCYGRTSKEADELRVAVHKTLTGLRNKSSNGVNVRKIFLQSAATHYVEPQDGRDGKHLYSMVYDCAIRELVPDNL